MYKYKLKHTISAVDFDLIDALHQRSVDVNHGDVLGLVAAHVLDDGDVSVDVNLSHRYLADYLLVNL